MLGDIDVYIFPRFWQSFVWRTNALNVSDEWKNIRHIQTEY